MIFNCQSSLTLEEPSSKSHVGKKPNQVLRLNFIYLGKSLMVSWFSATIESWTQCPRNSLLSLCSADTERVYIVIA